MELAFSVDGAVHCAATASVHPCRQNTVTEATVKLAPPLPEVLRPANCTVKGFVKLGQPVSYHPLPGGHTYAHRLCGQEVPSDLP